MVIEIPLFWYIMCVIFWFLISCLVIVFVSECYLHFMYYKWDAEDRRNNMIEDKVGEIIDEKMNPGGGISEGEN